MSNLLARAKRATDPEFADDYSAEALRALVAELADELRALAQETSEDVGIMEVQLDAEFGNGDSLEELIAAGKMPDSYTRAQALLKGLEG